MRLSIFLTVTNPVERQDPFYEALNNYLDLADEVVIVYGEENRIPMPKYLAELEEHVERQNIAKIKLVHYHWPEKFDWPFIGRQFQRGYEACTGDWVIHADCDYFFHEKDIPKIRELFEKNPDKLAYSFWKYQFLLVDRYNIKSRTVIAVNRAKYGDRIRFDSGGDLCQPSLDGKEITANDVPEARLPFYNYDFCFKELRVIKKDWVRFRKAWRDHFKSDFGEFKDMMVGRYNGREFAIVKIDDHPKYIKERVRSIEPHQFGHSMFGWLKGGK